jgi:hypothetical protein
MKNLSRLQEQINRVLSRKKLIFFLRGNTKPHTSVATSVVKLIQPDLTPSDFWLFAAPNKHDKENHFTCDEKTVLRTASRILQRQFRETCSVLEGD